MNQLDEIYLKAAKANDLETCRKLVDEQAKRAGFHIIPLYHQSKSDKPFNVFNNSITGGIKGIWLGDAEHMETSGQYGDYEREFYVKMYNPLTEDELGFFADDGGNYGNLAESPYKPEWIKKMIKKGYDGIAWNGGNGTGLIVVVFSPSQIKSADPVTYDDSDNIIPLSKRFNTNVQDIRENVFYKLYEQINISNESRPTIFGTC